MTNHSQNGNPGDGAQAPYAPDQQYGQQPVAPAPTQAHPSHPPQPQNTHPENQEPAVPEKPAKFIKPKRRPNKILRMMQLFMSIAFFAAIFLAGFVMYSRYQVDKPGPLAEATIFEVGKGQGLSTIADQLEKQGIIRNKRLFKLNPATIRVAKKLKAGKFAIPRRASMQQVLDILVRGRAIFYKVTIPEGLTSQQAVLILNSHPQLTGTITAIPPEGSLMPNTYQFDARADRAGILTKMTNMQQSFLTKQWPLRQKDLPFATPQEALILASIVEKETGISSERKRVAGVFVNRLKKGIKLQSDPTIIYGLVGGQGKLGHPLRRSEMNKKTGYNTYQIPGLPPTPIANPGAKSIEAVLNPENTKDLFFVANGTGGHSFAPTLKIHNQNVRKWRKIEAKRRAEKKHREAEEKRLAALEKKAKAAEKPLPGVTVTTPDTAAGKTGNGWGNDIPLPTRKPH